MSAVDYSSTGTMQFLHVILCDFGSILTSRESGRAVADAVRLHTEDPKSFILDFDGVDAIGPLALDEVLTAVGHHLRLHRDDNVTALVTNLTEANRAILEMVLERGSWPGLAHRTHGQTELLGARPQLQETLRAVQELGPFTAPELADRLEMKLPNTNQRLKLLLQAGAVGRVRDETAEHGTRFAYGPIPSDLDDRIAGLLDSSGVHPIGSQGSGSPAAKKQRRGRPRRRNARS